MKRFLRFLALVALMCVPWVTQAQTTVEIGDGTATSNQVPIGTYYNYSITEMLYTSDEIGTAGTISSISFYYKGNAEKDLPITVYMQNVDAADLSTGISLADAVQVFSGTLSVTTTAGWVTIDLDSPFAYDGTSNLLIGCIKDYLYYFSGQTWQGTSVSNMARYSQNDNNAYDVSTVPGTAASVRPNIQIVITPGGGPTCEKPTTLEVTNITPDGARVIWESNVGNYTLEYKTASESEWTVISGLSEDVYVFNTLQPLTTYNVRVKAVCGTDLESGYKTASFTTLAAIPLIEAFSSTTIPNGFTQYTGLLSNIIDGSATLSSTSYGWNFGTGNNIFDSHARVNIYGTSCNKWLVTPSLTMEDNVQLTFDLALTVYSSSSSDSPTPGNQADDKFVVLISTDNMATWEVLRQWDNEGSEYVYDEITNNAAGQSVAIDLSSYAGQSICIAFYGESTVSNGDNNLHIDNVRIDYIPSCAIPTGLISSNITAHGVTLNWVSEGADSWQLSLNDATVQEGGLQNTDETTFTYSGLTPETQYRVKVRSVCNGNYSEWTNNVTFTTAIACPKPTSFATSNVDGHSAVLTWTENGSATEWEFTYKASDEEDAVFDDNVVTVTGEPTYSLTGLVPQTTYNLKVRAVCGGIDGESQWTTRTLTTTVACPAPSAVTVTNITTSTAVVNCTSNAENFSIMLGEEVVAENVTLPYTLPNLEASTSYTVKVMALCGGEDGESEWSSSTTFMTADICPDGMVCIGAGTSTSNYLPAHNYYKYGLTEQIYTADEIGMAGAILSIDFYKASTNEMVKDLDIYIVATDKSVFESTSDWITVTAADRVYSGTVTFVDNDWTTIELDNPFIYDGESNIAIVVDNNTGEDVSSTPFRVFSAGSNQAIYQYNDGTNLDPMAETIGNASGVMSSKNRIRLAIGEPPACLKPTGLAVNYEGGTTAEVTWTGEADSYNISINGEVTEGVTSPYALEGLDLATTYEVMVQAVCGNTESEWTSAQSFTTDRCADACVLTIVLTDSYGDGWNGNNMNVVDAATEEVLQTYTLTSGNSEGTFTLAVCTGDNINFVYGINGSSSYPTENGWVITDNNDEVIAEHEGCNSGCQVAAGVLANYTANCAPVTCQKPTELAVVAESVTAHEATISWTANGDEEIWQIMVNGDEENLIEVSENPYTMIELLQGTEYTVKVRAYCDDEDQSRWSDAVSFTTLISCAAPTELTATESTANTVTISWTAGGDETEWNVYLGEELLGSVDENTYTFDGLEASSTYTVGVSALCDEESSIATITVNTACGAVDAPYAVDFEDADILSCWTLIDADGDGFNWVRAGHSPSSEYPAHSGSVLISSASYDNSTGALTPDNWLITPAINLPSDVNMQLSWWERGQDPSWCAETYSVYVSTTGNTVDDFNTEEDAPMYTATGDWVNHIINLSEYSGQTVYIAFRHYDVSDVFILNIDDISIEEAPACGVPTDVTVDSWTATSVNISWTDNNDGNATYAVFDADDNEITDVDNLTTTSVTVNGLQPETYYNFTVKAVCSESETSAAGIVPTFYTGYCQPTPGDINGNGITEVTFGAISVTNTVYPTAPPYYGNYSALAGIVYPGTTANVDITFETGTSYQTLIWVDWDNSLSFEDDEIVYSGSSASDNPTTLNATFDIDAEQELGDYRMRIGASQSYFNSNVNPCYTGSWPLVYHDYTLRVAEEPECMPVTEIEAVYEGGSIATVTWTSEADSWNIDVNGEVIEDVTSPYELTELEYGTVYTIKVQAVCGDNESFWSNPVSFTTDLCAPENQCDIAIVLTDAYGDGWNGNSMNVVDVNTESVLGTYTLASGSEETFTLAICDGREINFVFVQGSGSTYPYENGWTITDINEEVLSQHEGCSTQGDCEAPTAGVVLSHVASCTPPECVVPTLLAVSDVTAHTATINFESEASAWQYRLNNDDETIAGIQELPFVIEGLDASTDYSVEVRAICGNTNYSDWSNAENFTTLESCPAVTGVEVELVSTTSVNVTWNDANNAGNYYIMMGEEMLGEETEPAVIINEQTATITGLTAETNYALGAFQVFANCGELDGVSAGSDVPAFFTGYCVPNPTSRDGKGITSVVFGSGEYVVNNVDETNGLPDAAPFYGNYSDMIGAMPAGLESTIAITYATGSSTVYSYGTIIWVDWNNNMTFEDDEIVYTGTSAQGSGGTPQVLEASFVVPATQELGDYRMRIAGADSYFDNYINGNATGNHSACFTSTYSVCHDYTLRVTEAPSCLPAADVTVSNIGTTTADLTWVNNNGADATYTVKNGDEVLTTEAVAGYQLTGLTPAHNYAAGTFTVIANCDETAIFNVPAFATACDVIAAEGYAENFDEYTVASNYTAPSTRVLPNCWNAINTTTYSTNTQFPTVYYYSSTNYANSTPNCLKFYSSYSSYSNYDPQDQYAILPEMEGLAGKQITLQARGFNTISTFKVGLMTDPADASTFVAIATQDGLTTSYQEFEYIIPTDAEGNYVAIMIEAANSSRTGNGVYIDDITIDNPPACIKPTYLAATLIPAVGDKAILNWTENGDATAWEICLNGDEDNLIEVTENPYTLTDLTAEEIYTAKVRANCGDNGTSDWSNEVTFNPTNKIVIGEGTATSGYVPTQTNYDYSLTNQIYTVEELGEAGAIFSVDFFMTGSSNYTRNLDVYMVSTDKTGFEDGTDWISVTEDDLVFSGDVNFVAGDWTTITFTNPFVYDGINNVAIIVDDNTGSYSSRSFRVFSADGYQALYKYQDNNDIPVTFDGSGTRLSSKNQIRILKGEPPTCYKPTAVEATELTAEGATITWTRDERNAEGETYSILDENHEPVAEAEELTGDNFQLTGLEAAHEYTYYVRTNCANDEEVNLVAVTFTTLADCPAPTEVAVVENSVNAYNATISWTGYPANENGYLVSYRTAAYFDGVSEQFATTSAPTGWTRYSGLLSDVMNGTQLTTTTSGWTFGTGNNVFDNHAKVNIYGTGSKYWLVTPDIDVTEGYVLNFDMALTVWSSSSSASPTAGNQPDDKFVVLVSGDEMATWTILRQWDNEGSEYVYDDIPNTGENVSIDLSDFVGQTVNIAFYGESTASNGDNNLHIDNVGCGFDVAAGDWYTVNTNAEETTVELTELEPETLYEVKVQGLCADDAVSEESEVITFTTTPSCVPVTDVQVDNITTNSVEVSWTAGLITDNAWQIAYRENGASDWTEAAVYDNPFPLTNLTANTAYELRVRTFCSADEQSDWSNTVSFTTECDAIAIPYATGFESDDATLGCWSMVDVTGSTGVSNNRFQFYYNSNPPQYLISPELTGTENGVQVEFDYAAHNASYPESFVVGYSTTTNEPDAFTWGEELTDIASTTYQRHYEIIPVADVKYVAIKYTANNMWALYIDNFDVKEIEEFDVNVAVSTASGEPLGTVTSEPTDLTALYYNDVVSLTANTDVTGYEFKGWYDLDNEGSFITDANPYTFNVTSDRNILAAFGLIQYTVSVSADDNGTAYIIDPETSENVTSVTADYNSEVTLVAEANTCYEFVNWTLNGDPVSTDASYTINVLDNNAYVANFTEKSYTGEETVTACDSYEWNGTVYEESTTVDATLPSVEGCDSVATLYLTINNSNTGVDVQTACDSYTWIDGETYTESTNEAQFTLEGANVYGCDSTVTLNLTVNNSSEGVETTVVCDSYEWIDGETYTESTNEAQFTLEGANVYGCDSTVTLNLTVNYSTTYTDVQTACDSYEWIDGNTYTENNNTAQFTLENAAHCDSLVTLNFTVRRSTAYTDVQIACDEFEWIDGETYTESNNEATFTTTNVANCDSVITLNLTVNYSSEGVVEETACNSFVWHGTNYTASTEDTYQSVNLAGCDSVTTLYLTINHCATTTVTACDSYEWSITGQTYTESNTYIDGNDTLILTINHSNTGIETVTACDRYDWFEHTNLTVSSDNLTHEFTNVAGCDSIVTLHLTVNYSNTGVDVQTACDSYTWIDGIEYTANNTVAQYTLENGNVDGCDSVVTLNLTVNYSNTGVDEQVACDEFEWIDGNVYTESNNEAQFTLENIAGCDSVVTLNLTVNYSTTYTDEQIACDSFEWIDGETYTESNNTATFTTTNVAGCDSVITLNLTVNYSNIGVDEQIACDEFEWIDGNVYTESNNEAQFTLENIAGCDSVVTLNLTINHSNTGVDEQIACDEFEWIDGNVYTESNNTATFTTTNVAGCDSVVTLNLTVNYSNSEEVVVSITENELPYTFMNTVFEAGVVNEPIAAGANVNGCDSTVIFTLIVYMNGVTNAFDTICDNELPYTWNNVEFTEAGMQTAHLEDIHGADSIVNMYLTVKYGTHTTETVAACDEYIWHGETYTESDTYVYEYNNVDGCASDSTLNLTIRVKTTGVDEQIACDSYTWIDGNVYTESNNEATFTLEGANAAGCDSVVTLNLTVNYSNTGVDEQVACDSYEWIDGNVYTESNNEATFTLEGANVAGCDSVVTLNLTINHSNTGVDEQIACDEFEWIDGNVYTESNNTATFTLTNIAGCDSVVTLNLTINYSTESTVEETIYENELPYTFNGEVFDGAETRDVVIDNLAGCDSTIHYTLNVNWNSENTDEQTICASLLPYTWNGVTFENAGTKRAVLPSATGADSVVIMTLNVYPITDSEFSAEVCASYTWNDITYAESGDFEQVFTDQYGCDSTVTLHLTINNVPINVVDEQTACDSYTWIDGIEYTESNNTATFTETSVDGCDSIITLNLTINYSTEAALSETVLQNQLPYTWDGLVFEGAETRDTVIANLAGCDSTIHYTLNVIWNSENTDEKGICASQLPYEWNGVWFETAGTKPVTLEDIHGADSVVIMTLNVYPEDNTEFSEAACMSYIWNNTTYSEDGDYVQHFENMYGCDSTVTLHLTINTPVHMAETVETCESYTWNDSTYTESGDYTYSHEDIHGCEQVDTLHLIINNPVHMAETAEACESYIWNGTLYTESGNYTFAHTDAHGCNQVDTLHLTINTPVHVAETAEACESYTWNTNEYTASGDYTFAHADDHGCNQVDTLHLTIYNAVPEVVSAVAYDTYTWNNNEYTESGEYTYSHADAHGCNQVDTLHLTINHYDSIIVYLTVNDANMGTTDPVAGRYSFYPGDVVTATATANAGYEFVGWVVGNAMFSDTVSREATVTYEILPMMQGMTINVEAVFRQKVGIETADYSNINIFSADNRIYVKGAEGMTIYIYDVNGRCMERRANAADSETFTVETTGVVLVKAGNAPAKRVVLVR